MIRAHAGTVNAGGRSSTIARRSRYRTALMVAAASARSRGKHLEQTAGGTRSSDRTVYRQPALSSAWQRGSTRVIVAASSPQDESGEAASASEPPLASSETRRAGA